jgi:translocation and assembly module TamB
VSWRWLRWFGWPLAAGLTGVLALLAGTVLLGGSEGGTRWLWQLAREVTPGQLAGTVTGRLGGRLEVRGLHYRAGDLDLELPLLRLDWNPAALLQGRLQVAELVLDGPRLTLPAAAADDPPAAPFPGLALPLALELGELRVTDLQLQPEPGAEAVRVERLQLAAVAAGTRVEIRRLEAAAFAARVAVQGHLDLQPDLPLALTLDWHYQVPEGPLLRGQGRADGDLRRLRLTQTLAAPAAGRLEATAEALETAPRWDARLDLERLDLGALAPAFPGQLSGRLRSAGDPADLGLEGRLDLQSVEFGQLLLNLQARFAAGRLTLQQLTARTPAGGELRARGQVALAGATRALDLELDWQALRWPLSEAPAQVQSPRGRLRLDGTPEDYAYQLSGDLELPEQPALQLQGAGRGGLQGLRLAPLQVRLPRGQLALRGQLSWAPRLAWQASLEADGLDPSLFQPDFPGHLALALDSRGELGDAGLQLEAQLHRLEGVLRDLPLQGRGRVRLAGGDLQLEDLELGSGQARVSASGRLGQTWALQWDLAAPDLGHLWPGLQGALNGRGRLGGSATAPQIEARLEGAGLAYGADLGVARLGLTADLALGEQAPLRLDLQATELRGGGYRWSRATLTGSGTRARHRLELVLQGPAAPALEAALGAGLSAAGDDWAGQLQRLRLTLPGAGDWTLAGPAGFRLGARAQRLESLCLNGEPGALCATFDGQAATGWQARLEAPRLALEALQPLLPEAARLTGQGRLEAEVRADAAGVLRGQARLGLPRGAIGMELSGEARQIDFSGAELVARLQGEEAGATLQVPLAGLGELSGQLRLPGLDPARPDPDRQKLEGSLSARVADLTLLSALVPRLMNVRGRVAADFTLSGTLATPQLRGRAALEEGALDVPELGLQVRELGLEVTAPALDRLSYQGSARSGAGRIALEGETRLDPAGGWPTRLTLKGEDWQAVDTAEAEVQVSPALTLNHDQTRTRLEGEVRIPYARLRPRELPVSSVASSADLVVVGGDAPAAAAGNPKFYSRLRIVFGDRVNFQGFGLRAKLTGDLQVIDEPGRPVIGRGRVGIAEGTYRAYGQDLKIERGYALFAGGPVDNPGLDVRAVREAGDVTAGLRVTGSLKKPDLELFSTPAMTQSEVLSYLLTGGPSDSGSLGSGTGVKAALAASGAGTLTSELSRQLGLDELRVETGSSLADASMVAGTWLSPRLYVQYVNDLATRDSKLRFRYDLTRKIQLQTETGRSQGVDLYYTFER